MKYAVIYLFLINLVTFLLFGLDKWKARSNQWRIPEKTLLGSAVLGGSIGAFLGMRLFRHKTQKLKFVLGIPCIFFIQAGVMYLAMKN